MKAKYYIIDEWGQIVFDSTYAGCQRHLEILIENDPDDFFEIVSESVYNLTDFVFLNPNNENEDLETTYQFQSDESAYFEDKYGHWLNNPHRYDSEGY